MAAIDYDPYDALLHHVYQQVRSPTPGLFRIAHAFGIRHREKRGLGPRRNTLRQVSAFAQRRVNSEFFRMTMRCWSRLRRQSDC